jgi:hypothetical protein
MEEALNNVYRGLALEHFQQVIETGIDVHPTNEAFFADGCVSKALEYGKNQMFRHRIRGSIVLALSRTKIERSFRMVPENTRHSEMLVLENRYGRPPISGVIPGHLWYSRFRPENESIRTFDFAGSPEERNWGYWIPGNALDAVRFILVFAGQEWIDQSCLAKVSQEAVADLDIRLGQSMRSHDIWQNAERLGG